ncbi:virion structural protein [Arthrobacter phage Faja]|uniref:Minor tail protein n=1 Tax=Arthrobacter phage Faja TaxID=2419957 RepID=A0A3G2KFV6_9CAUD|nr:virion structural protein [Arthrobacter phage Faja]AYN57874.1 minor tail protein [Arthrobacter phage Faja]
MTITFLAPDGVAVTAQQERQAKAALFNGGAGRPLGGRSGLRVDTSSTVLVATTTTWTLKPCSAMIDPGASTHQGMYGWATDADVTGAVTAADATYDRKDIVYIQINDSSAGDGSGALTAPVGYLAGTPSATPVAPSLPARSFLLGTITVPKVGAGSPTVAVNPARFVAAGGILPVYSSAERDALTKYDGLAVRRMDLSRRPVETWDGSAWSLGDYYETSATVTSFSTGWSATAGYAPKVYRQGNRVFLEGAVTLGSGADWSSILTIPAGFRPSANAFLGANVSSTGAAAVELTIGSTGVIGSPDTYRTGSLASGNVLPVKGSWPV